MIYGENQWGQVHFLGMASRMPLKSVWKKAGGVRPREALILEKGVYYNRKSTNAGIPQPL